MIEVPKKQAWHHHRVYVHTCMCLCMFVWMLSLFPFPTICNYTAHPPLGKSTRCHPIDHKLVTYLKVNSWNIFTCSHIIDIYAILCKLFIWLTENCDPTGGLKCTYRYQWFTTYLYVKQTFPLILIEIQYIRLNYSWTKHCRNGRKKTWDTELSKVSYTVQSIYNVCCCDVTMIWRDIVKVYVCCEDVSVSDECLIAKEEVWRFLKSSQVNFPGN